MASEKISFDASQGLRALDSLIDKLEKVGEQIGMNSEELKGMSDNVKKTANETNKNVGATNKSFGNLGNIVPKVGAAMVAAFAVDVIKNFATEAIKLEKQFTGLERTIQRFSNLSGKALLDTTAQVQSLSTVFNKSNEEILIAANNFAQQYQITLGEALDLVEDGFLNGADSSGDFLNILKQYPVQFKNAQISAENFIKIATQQAVGGVFSDKLLDTIKELGLSVREFDKAQKDALNPLGATFTSDLFNDVAKNGADIVDILRKIAKRSEEIGLTTQQTQKITADFLKGAGEDAGGYEEVLRQVNLAIDRNLENLDALGQAQKTQLDQQFLINKEYAIFSRSIAGTSDLFTNVYNSGVLFFFQGINNLIAGTKAEFASIGTFFSELFSTSERGLFFDTGEAAKKAKEAFNAVLQETKNLRAEAEERRKKELEELEKKKKEIALKEEKEKQFKLFQIRQKANEAELKQREDLESFFASMELDNSKEKREKELEELESFLNKKKELERDILIDDVEVLPEEADPFLNAFVEGQEERRRQIELTQQATQNALGSSAVLARGLGAALGGSAEKFTTFVSTFLEGTQKIIAIQAAAKKQSELLAAAKAKEGAAKASTLPFPANIAAIASVLSVVLGAFGTIDGLFRRANKGEKRVPGVGNSDTVPYLLTPGERVTTAQDNRALSPTFAALDSKMITPLELNSLVNERLNKKATGTNISVDSGQFAKAIEGLPVTTHSYDINGYSKHITKRMGKITSSKKRFK